MRELPMAPPQVMVFQVRDGTEIVRSFPAGTRRSSLNDRHMPLAALTQGNNARVQRICTRIPKIRICRGKTKPA